MPKKANSPFRPICAECGERWQDLDTYFYHRRGPLDARRCMGEAELRHHGLRKSVRGWWKFTTLEERQQVAALKKRVYEQHRKEDKP